MFRRLIQCNYIFIIDFIIFNIRYSLKKKNRNTSYEFFSPFPKLITSCTIWVPFSITKKYRERMIRHIDQIYVDCLMILISFESDIKIVGNLIELVS